jgi:hypothetical protein
MGGFPLCRRIRAITSELPTDPTAQRAWMLLCTGARVIKRANRDSALTEPLTLVYSSCPILPSSNTSIPESRAI